MPGGGYFLERLFQVYFFLFLPSFSLFVGVSLPNFLCPQRLLALKHHHIIQLLQLEELSYVFCLPCSQILSRRLN